MTPADLARQAAIAFECKKDSLRQTQAGTWKVAFTVIDMDERLTRAMPGTRYQAVLVEIGDDELPVQQPVKEVIPPAKPLLAPKSAGVKRDWRDLSPQQQAGIHCADPIFAAFLREQRPDDWHESQDAAACVRLICGVDSRKLLESNQRARIIWHQLDSQYQAWKALEHA
jgi:hypothetical protein